MLRETEPSLIALYGIWPGNGAGLFLQPQSPHGAPRHKNCLKTVSRQDTVSRLNVTGSTHRYPVGSIKRRHLLNRIKMPS